jgi:chromate transporter
MQPDRSPSPPGRHAWDVFFAFLKLGLTSFGGPVAHLGYFRDELVLRRKWLNEAAYADLVALCQFLPGPASSQVGFALGYFRGGMAGAIAAWAAFTLPSAALLVAFALVAASIDSAWSQHALHGLKLVAVAIVAHAVWGMARTLTPDKERATIALAAVLVLVAFPSAFGQLLAIAVGALAGAYWCRHDDNTGTQNLRVTITRPVAKALIGLFFVLLLGLPLWIAVMPSPSLALFEAFYRAGALVFGGGHVVLPLLETSVVASGWITPDAFLTGYGLAQAVPGPLFTFAAYLGAIAEPGPGGIFGASIALFGIFLPGMLLLMGVLPFWNQLRDSQLARACMAGTNAAVVGILAMALFDPIWISTVISPSDFAIALAGFVLLAAWRTPPWLVVIAMVSSSIAVGVLV